MQFPADLHLGSYNLSIHLLLETFAFFIGFRYFLFLRKRQNDSINDANRVIILIGTIAGAFVFSRILGAFENPQTLINSPHKLLYLFANKTIVGGLLGGLIGAELTKKIIGEEKSSGDLITYPLILAMMIGRIGCFTSGVYEETYGIETHSIFGMNLGDGMPRHPVTLYEIFFLFCLWLLLYSIEKRTLLKNGYRFKIFMIAYLTFRLFLDFIKPGDRYFFGLGTIQIACILGLAYYGKTIFTLLRKPKLLTTND
ncbi:MAG TPA: prolipoprotein diacylglyceryl transferase family protein [Bacteroidia bacterium]|jgi:phosphatidylglycerol:prolipoprotein diacylglycerol transferase|nr:prolipoprotein diacylglyceryl transferase family protein [Bacteroidia bacterium]